MSDVSNGEVEYTQEELASIRVRYSTIVNYLSQVYRLLLTILFTLIVARKLSVEDYGLWITIIGVANVLTMAHWIWGMWSLRFYARKKYEMVSAAYALTLIYIPISLAVFMLVGLWYNSVLGWGLSAFLIASLLAVSEAFNYFLRSIVLSSRPYIEGKAVMVRVTVRLAVAYALVVMIKAGLVGVMVSTIIGSVAAVITRYALLRRQRITIPKPRFSLKEVTVLVKNAYISVIAYFSSLLINVEKPLVTALTASTNLTAYLGVAYVPRSIITRSSSAMGSGLTPKLLRVPSRRDVEDILRIAMTVNLGITFLIVMMGKPILSLLKLAYVDAYVLLVIITAESLLYTISILLGTVASSSERADLQVHGIKLSRTPIFKSPMASLIRCVVALGLGTAGMLVMIHAYGLTDNPYLVLPYPLAWLGTSLPLLIYMYRLAKSKVEFSFPKRETVAGIAGGIVMSLYMYVSGASSILVRNFWHDAPVLALHALAGLILYGIVILALSPWSREFLKLSLKFVRSK